MSTVISRRTVLTGSAASAVAALLAACGGGSATDTPKPATSAAPTAAGGATTTAPTTAAGSAAATRPAGSATSAPAGTTAPSGTTAAGTTTTSATTAAGSAPAGTTAAGTTTSAAAGTVAPAATVKPDAFKGKSLNFYKGIEYYKAVQDFVTQEVTAFVKGGGGSADIAIQSDQGAQNLAKIQAGVEGGNPFDLVDGRGGGVQQLVTLNLVQDVSDIVKEMTDLYGAPMPILAQGLVNNGKWYGVPWSTSSDAWFLRRDKLDAKGIKPENLKTYDDMRDAALAISDPANKFYGWGNSVYPTGDGTTLIFHVIHNWGGAITDKTGTKVTFNTPETVAGVTWLADVYQNAKYKPMLSPGWESWTDSSNNEAFLNGSVGITANAFTLYAKAHDDKNPVFPNTVVLPRPVGPAHPEGLRGGQLGYLYITRGAKNADVAKEVIRHLMQPEVWNKYAAQAGALVLPAYESQWKLPYFTGDFRKDPNYAPLETQVRDKAGYDQIYYPAPPNPGTDGVNSQNVLLDMMAQILQKNAKPADAVKDAHDRMVKIFEQVGLKQ